MENEPPRRFRLPIAVVREPRVAEGPRSLSTWSTIRGDLANDAALVVMLHSDPHGFFARYGIVASAEEVKAWAKSHQLPEVQEIENEK